MTLPKIDLDTLRPIPGEYHPNRKPFDEENLPALFTAAVAFTFHDLIEDFGPKSKNRKFFLQQMGRKLQIRNITDRKKVHQVEFPDKDLAKDALTMIKAYTKPEEGVNFTAMNDEYSQFIHLVRSLEVGSINYPLLRILSWINKEIDRQDNMSTYYDIARAGMTKEELREKRRQKLADTFHNFFIPGEYLYYWQNTDTLYSGNIPINPPQLRGEVILRLLGATLNDLYQPAIDTCKPYEEELVRAGIGYAVVIDPFAPMIISDDGIFIPVTK